MTSEMLNEILKIEEDAAAAELAAKVKAEEIIKEAKLKADTVIAHARQQAGDNTSAVLAKAKQKTAEIKRAATDVAKAEGARTIEDARKKHPDAIKALRDYLLPVSGI